MNLLYIVIPVMFGGGCYLCYYLGSENRAPSKAEKRLSSDLDAKLAEIFKLRRELQQQTALAMSRCEIIKRLKEEGTKV